MPRHESLAIGPLNVAGQATQWAEAARRFLSVDAFSFAGTRRKARSVDGPSHARIPHHRVRPTMIKRLAVGHVLRGTTHVLDESFATLVGDQRFDNFSDDIEWLVSKGMSVGCVFHGSDIRSPRLHLEREPDSYYRLMPEDEIQAIERATAERRARAVDSGLPLFVSTPDLLLDLPEATWLPLTADLGAWTSTRPALDAKRIRVLHVPSRRTPPIKGTSFIEPVLRALDAEGVLDFIAPERVDHQAMPRLVGSVDVVIEQILMGSYGLTAVEAMAAGRLVIGSVSPEVRAAVDADIPILNATPQSLESVLRGICDAPANFQEMAGAGVRYVANLHSGARSAKALAPFLGLDADAG